MPFVSFKLACIQIKYGILEIRIHRKVEKFSNKHRTSRLKTFRKSLQNRTSALFSSENRDSVLSKLSPLRKSRVNDSESKSDHRQADELDKSAKISMPNFGANLSRNSYRNSRSSALANILPNPQKMLPNMPLMSSSSPSYIVEKIILIPCTKIILVSQINLININPVKSSIRYSIAYKNENYVENSFLHNLTINFEYSHKNLSQKNSQAIKNFKIIWAYLYKLQFLNSPPELNQVFCLENRLVLEEFFYVYWRLREACLAWAEWAWKLRPSNWLQTFPNILRFFISCLPITTKRTTKFWSKTNSVIC